MPRNKRKGKAGDRPESDAAKGGHPQKILYLFLAWFVIYLFVYNYFYWGNDFNTYDNRWYPCLELLKEGRLYLNQPYCEQGFLVFMIPEIPYVASGGSVAATRLVTNLISYALLIGTFLLMLRIAGKDRLDRLAFAAIFLLLYVFAVQNKFDMALATFLCALGYHLLLRGGNSRLNAALAGLSFALAMHAKFSSIVIIAIAAGYRAFALCKEKRMLEAAFASAAVIAPIALSYMILLLSYPRYLLYTLIVHYEVARNSVFGALASFPDFSTPFGFFSIITLALSFYALYKLKNGYALLGSLGLLAMGFLTVKSFGGAFSVQSYYVGPALAFSALSLGVLLSGRRNLLLLFLIAGIAALTINEFSVIRDKSDTCSRRIALEKPLSFIETKGDILIEGSREYRNFLISCLSLQKIQDRIVNVENIMGYGRLVDPVYGENLLRHLGSSADRNATIVDKRFFESLVAKVRDREISVVIAGPPDWAVTAELITAANMSLYTAIPSNGFRRGEGRDFDIIYFTEESEMSLFQNRTLKYYFSAYEDICRANPHDARLINTMYWYMSYDFPKRCLVVNNTQ